MSRHTLDYFTWNDKLIFWIRKTEYEASVATYVLYFLAYDFQQRKLEYIGKEDRSGLEILFSVHKYVEHKDAVYFVTFKETEVNDDQEGLIIKVQKLTKINHENCKLELVSHDMIFYATRYELFTMFVKDDILYIFFLQDGRILSFDLNNEGAKLQTRQVGFVIDSDSDSVCCYHNQHIYVISGEDLLIIDFTDMANVQKKSHQKLVYNEFETNNNDESNQKVLNECFFMNGKIYYFKTKGSFYEIDIEKNSVKQLLPDMTSPFSNYRICKSFVTANNVIQAYGNCRDTEDMCLVEMTLDDIGIHI